MSAARAPIGILPSTRNCANCGTRPRTVSSGWCRRTKETTMYALSAAVVVNPPGVTPILSADQVWRGLVMKAENALPFVDAMQECRVVERFEDGFVREIVLRGVRMRERITFSPPAQVHFQRLEAGGHDGWITNVISESANGLMLVFTFCVGFP